MTRALIALVALAIAVPTSAAAQTLQTNAPPGNAAVDEYLETIPGASGNTRPPPPGGSHGGVLTAAQRARLEHLGPDGKTLADAVDATAHTAPKRAAKTGSKSKPTVPHTSGRSPAREVLDAVSGSDGGNGMGVLLPVILLAALLTAIVLVLLRRRSTS